MHKRTDMSESVKLFVLGDNARLAVVGHDAAAVVTATILWTLVFI